MKKIFKFTKKHLVKILLILLLVSSVIVNLVYFTKNNTGKQLRFQENLVIEKLNAQSKVKEAENFLDNFIVKVDGRETNHKDYFGATAGANGRIWLTSKAGQVNYDESARLENLNINSILTAGNFRVQIGYVNKEGRNFGNSIHKSNAKDFQFVFYDYYNTGFGMAYKADVWLGAEKVEENKIVYQAPAPSLSFVSEPIAPAISGKDTIINNIDSPYSLEDIARIANIKAIDDYYGDITSSIQIKTDNYSSNIARVGQFNILYTVTNDFGLTTEYMLNIINKDLTAPVITGQKNSSQSYTQAFKPEDIIELYTAIDNYDTDIVIKLDSHDYVENQVGIFTFNLSATDSSGNTSYDTHYLTIFDDQKPEIKSKNSGTIKLNWKDTFTDSKLLIGLTATDFIDGDLTDAIEIKSSNIKNKVGKYLVEYQVKDNAGNIATFEQPYEVITSDAPEFWVSINLINIEDVNKLSVQQIVDIISSYEKITYSTYQVITDEYTGNEDISGNYNVTIAFTDKSGNIIEHSRIMSVFNGEDLNTEVDSFWYKLKNFFNKVWNGIKTVFNFIWKVVTAPFKWLGKLLGIGKTKSIVVTRFRL